MALEGENSVNQKGSSIINAAPECHRTFDARTMDSLFCPLSQVPMKRSVWP